MEVMPGIRIIDLALIIKDNLIICDTHIGAEEELNKKGILIPRTQFKEELNRMKKIFTQIKNINNVIINGDIKHEFGTISDEEWRNTLKFLDLLETKFNKIILIKGNHDTILAPIAKKRKIQIFHSFQIGKVLIIHGDKEIKIPKEVETLIIGHEHPAITIRDGVTSEIYKCFLKGKYQKIYLIVQPSFNLLSEGTDVSREKILSPYLQKGIKNFEVYAVGKKVYYFGKVGDLVKVNR